MRKHRITLWLLGTGIALLIVGAWLATQTMKYRDHRKANGISTQRWWGLGRKVSS